MIYNTLKLYGTVRSKSLINHFFHLGIAVSYDRVLELTKEYADNLVKDYNDNQVFCPSTLKRKVFSIIAKDNIVHNARSTTATKHYHGTSMTVMQFLSEDQSRIEKIEENQFTQSKFCKFRHRILNRNIFT